MIRPRHPKPDANQAAIVEECEKAGIYVWVLSDLGGEVLDTLMFKAGICIPVEIKVPGQERAFTKGEIEGMRRLSSVGVFPLVATSAEEIIRVFEVRAEIR